MDYVKITDYAAKDALLTGNPAKLVKGTEIGADFDAVAVAVATKHDSADIGVTVQAYSANLDEYAAVNPTAAGLAILDDATASDQLTTLGGTTVGKAVFTAATVAAAQQATDTEVGVDVMAYVAPGTSGNVLTSNGSIWTSAASSSSLGEGSLTQFYSPANGSGFQDLYRSGWMLGWFNQQWGGAQWGTLPDGNFGSVATGNVQDDSYISCGTLTSYQQEATAFYVSEAMTSPTVWVKVYKNGDPTDNLTVGIYTDSAGSPNAIVGSAGSLSAKLITSKTDGEWYGVSVASGALSANTKYWVVVSRSGSLSDTLFFICKITAAPKYPWASTKRLASSVWTTLPSTTLCFLIQNPAANSIIQSGGQFDYKLAFNPGSPVNQSRSVAQPLANFYDGKSCSVLYRGTYAVSTNVWDFCYGLDHDRITLTINGSGYPVLTIYESDRTVATVTGTGSVTSGFHDVGIRVRTVGDGSDYATLYVDGVSVGTPLTAQTFTMDVNMKLLGTARLGDGFGLAPTWTNDSQFTALPSTLGWSPSGTLSASESTVMSIQGGKLYQNKNGFGSTDTFYYTRTAATSFVNATGWTVSIKCRVPTGTNTATADNTGMWMRIMDGTKGLDISIQEYFMRSAYGGNAKAYVQGDFKSVEHVFTICGKGSDYYVFIDGKLAIDGTGGLTDANASNNIEFGDRSATASENDDVVYSYVKYYQGGMILPTASTGTCSEFAHWSGDKSSLFSPLWNSGTPVSVKQLCGVPRNYQFEQVVQKLNLRDVTTTTTSSTSLVVTPEMEGYAIGSDIVTTFNATNYNDTLGSTISGYIFVDGVQVTESFDYFKPYANSATGTVASVVKKTYPMGLRKIDHRWKVSANTGGRSQSQITVEGKS